MVTGLRGQPVREHCYREHPGLLAKEAWEAYKTSLETGWLALFNKLSSQSQSFLIAQITDFVGPNHSKTLLL